MIHLQYKTMNDQQKLSHLRNIQWTGEAQLPVPPQSVMDFSARARKPDVTVRELAEVVECEPALTAELLRNVNSCLRGLRQKVDSIPQAIALLGIPNSTTILLTSALSSAVQQQESPLISASDFRRESVERSIFAREVARIWGLNPTIAYTAAMLQDILLPVLTRRHQIEYHEYLNYGDFESITQFERERFGWTHSELTAKTLLNWGFSSTIALAVLQHHEPPEQILVEGEEIPLAFALSCSSLLMDVMRQTPNGMKRLFDMKEINEKFNIMEVAAAVDMAVAELNSNLHNPISLVHRLQNGMLNQLDQRRRQMVVPGRQFGNYILEEMLKESTMGAIYKSRHVTLRRPAAVKVLRADRTNSASIAQFETEVQLTSQLRHPNTVAIFDYGRTPDDLFFCAMELIDGITLADLVSRSGPLPDGRVLNILLQVCGALAEAHGMDLIHRDIKPENIMISCRANRPDHVTLLDFGLVASTSAEHMQQQSEARRDVVGTPLFMSPEAAQGRDRISAQSDLYSLGAVAYTLLTGLPVFTGATIAEVLQQHQWWSPVPPSERVDIQISAELEQLVMQCLQKKTADRPADALELIDRLSKIVPTQPWHADAATRWWSEYKANVSGTAPKSLEPASTALNSPANEEALLEKTIHL